MESLDNLPAAVVPPSLIDQTEAKPPASGGDPPPTGPLSGEPERQQSDAILVPVPQPEAPGLLSDCRLMLRYASVNAFVLTPELVRQIAWLDAVLKLKNISPISALTSALTADISPATAGLGYVVGMTLTPTPANAAAPADPGAGASTGSRPLSTEEVVLRVHSDLSQLIAPTTALSLQTSEPAPGRVRIFGGMPRLIKTAIVIAVISALAFVISAVNVKDANTLTASAAPKDAAVSIPALPVKKNPQELPVKEPASPVAAIQSPPSAPASAPSSAAAMPQTRSSATSPATDGGKK